MPVDIDEYSRQGVQVLEGARQHFVSMMEHGKENPEIVGEIDNKMQIVLLSAAFGDVSNAYLDYNGKGVLKGCQSLIEAAAALAAGISVEGTT